QMFQGPLGHIPLEYRDVAAALVGHQKKSPTGVQDKIPGPVPTYGLPAQGDDQPRFWIHGKDRDGVLPPVGRVKETAVRGKVEVRTGIVAPKGRVQGARHLDFGIAAAAIPFENGNRTVQLIDHIEMSAPWPEFKVPGT